MKIAYFDCFSGASGDMILGALLDAGLNLEQLKGELAKLQLSHYDLEVHRVLKKGIGGSQAMVLVEENHHHHRHLSDITNIIEESELSESIKRDSLTIFGRLAEAEAKVHRTSVEDIHFHEVGAVDAIIDVVGAVIGFSALGIEKVCCSPLHVGTGTVECAHGILPVPAPATAELIQGKPIYSTGVEGELLTPTGAAILTTLSSNFGAMPAMTVESIGYGAGTSEPAIPNLLRVLIGEAQEEIEWYDRDRVAVIETNIDDMNPQIYDYLIQKVLDSGALDITLAPVHMKKNRPATLLTLVCPLSIVGKISDIIIRETTTIGLRWRMENRIKARRRIIRVKTRYGPVRIKVAESGDEEVNFTPEYDDCKRLALDHKVPLKKVMEVARAAVRAKDIEE